MQVGKLVAGWVIDPDGDVLGIAVTGITTKGGHWEYDEGLGWKPLDTATTSSALLLRLTDQLRFVPNAGFNGSAEILFEHGTRRNARRTRGRRWPRWATRLPAPT